MAVVDPRCLHDWLFPPDDTETEVYTKHCSIVNNGECTEYAESPATSLYAYEFAYSSEQCGESG